MRSDALTLKRSPSTSVALAPEPRVSSPWRSTLLPRDELSRKRPYCNASTGRRRDLRSSLPAYDGLVA